MAIKNIPDPSKAIIKCPDCKNKMDFLYELNLSLFQCSNCKTIALCHVDGEGEFFIVSANRKDPMGNLNQDLCIKTTIQGVEINDKNTNHYKN